MPSAPFLARNIREAREERDLTQRELSIRLGCDPVLVSKWENGRHAPSRVYKRKLVRVLGRDAEWFSTDHDDEPVAA